MRVAAIDLGTVTCRLAVADVEGGRVASIDKVSQIVNVGEGVDENRRLAPEAMARTIECVRGYVKRARAAGVEATIATLTSAARDATNSSELTGAFEELGLAPQVIPGKVEGSLTFLGVAQDFPSERILVADNGGGSTELVVGALNRGALELEWVRSIDVGCRRVTERFLASQDPPSHEDLLAAHAFAGEEFSRAAAAAPELPSTLVVTGGTATTLVALRDELVPYDSTRVHLARLTGADIARLEDKIASVPLAQRAELPGIQPKRAPVILGGVVAILELMRVAGADAITVSESDLLVGLVLSAAAELAGDAALVGWRPKLGPGLR